MQDPKCQAGKNREGFDENDSAAMFIVDDEDKSKGPLV